MRNQTGQRIVMILSFFLAVPLSSVQATPGNSGDTEACLECHKTVYGVFANGRWHLSKNIQEMLDWVKVRLERTKTTLDKGKKAN